MHIYPIKSLKECAATFIKYKKQDSVNRFAELPGKFWKEILNQENVKELLEFSSGFDIEDDLSDNIKNFINSKNIEAELENTINIITNIGIENTKYFNAIENITYLLIQFSEFYYNNITFTLDTAFDIDANSIMQITELAQNSEYNPYHEFLEEYFVPLIKNEKPDIVFINGRPNLFNFSQIYFVKKHFPNTYIFISNHSTEYYSLNKITKYLKTNELLFSWVDGIILDDFKYTEALITQAVNKKTDFTNIPNLMLGTYDGIKQTAYLQRERKLDEIIIPDLLIENDNLPNIKSPLEIFETILLQNNKCHWSGCSYCGINAKYPTKTNSAEYSINEYLDLFDRVEAKGYKLLVLQDEAIPIDVANKLALGKIARNNNIAWHYRSKIDVNYSDEIISNLAKSNLKGIYFGLESINKRVLELMNKYDGFIEPSYIENLADRLFDNGIHCHYCCIIGFPSETRGEINETLNFIAKIKTKHPSFTFTVNVFEPDIASPLFTQKEKYNLSAQIPVQDDLYIGNNLLFERDIPYEELLGLKIKFLLDNISDVNENANITEVMENPNSLINYINSKN